jgi:hypothetical protein
VQGKKRTFLAPRYPAYFIAENGSTRCNTKQSVPSAIKGCSQHNIGLEVLPPYSSESSGAVAPNIPDAVSPTGFPAFLLVVNDEITEVFWTS